MKLKTIDVPFTKSDHLKADLFYFFLNLPTSDGGTAEQPLSYMPMKSTMEQLKASNHSNNF